MSNNIEEDEDFIFENEEIIETEELADQIIVIDNPLYFMNNNI